MKGKAQVTKHTGSHYLLEDMEGGELFPAVLRGRMRLKDANATNPVAVGDIVDYEYEDSPSAENPAAMVPIHPRLKLPFLDRILLTCEAYKIPAIIVLNKTDLYRDEVPEELARFHEIYEKAGYRVIETSTLNGEGIDELRSLCEGRLSLFSGESGVGKSSMIKALDPSLDPKTGEISLAHLQGRHTTTFYEMYEFSSPSGAKGKIIDPPGIRGFGLVDLEKEEIPLYFPEMLRASENCRFTPCTHTHEPGCAVKAALEDGSISRERYNSYLGMLEDINEGKYR